MPEAFVVTVLDEDVNSLRGMVGETPVETSTYTDLMLAEKIAITLNADATVNLDRAAANIWRDKAALLQPLVDTAESGSSRKNSDLMKNALAMAKDYDARVAAYEATLVVAAAATPRTREIVRP